MSDPAGKGDVDRNLWTAVLHPAQHRALAEKSHIQDSFIKHGGLQHSRLLITVAAAVDGIEKEALSEAMKVLNEFSQRLPTTRAELTSWARHYLETFNDNMLGVLPPGFPPEQRGAVMAQYRAVFSQRLDGALRNFEIGFIDGRSVIPGQPTPAEPAKKDIFFAKPAIMGVGLDVGRFGLD